MQAVCPNLLCLSPPIISVPTYYVCPHRLCLSPLIMFVPTHHFFADKPFLNLECGTSSPACPKFFSDHHTYLNNMGRQIENISLVWSIGAAITPVLGC